MNVPIPARTPEEVSAMRANMYATAADEIDKIDKVKLSALVKGSIGVAFDAINAAIGKSDRDIVKLDERKLSLLTSAFTECFGVTIKNPAHLFCEIRKRVGDERDVYGRKAVERQRIAKFMRRVGQKLCNGHAGVWI